MADGNDPDPLLLPDVGYPPQKVAVVYSDGITSFTPGIETVKFYLSRLEPNFISTEPSKVIVTAQVIMPLNGFLMSVSFLQHVVATMVESGTVTQARVDQITAGRYKK
jgi:hypothetical protein